MYTLAMGMDKFCIHLPPEVGKDVNKYNATLGHKANHGFEFTYFSSPNIHGNKEPHSSERYSCRV